jgi:hypothetical protein
MTTACAAFSSSDITTTMASIRRVPSAKVLPLKTAFVRPQNWIEPIVDRLSELMHLQAGWDGHRARPLSRENAVFALSILSAVMDQSMPVPSLVPTVGGSVQIEWHTLKGDVELRIHRPNSVHAWFSSVDDDQEPEVDLTWDFKIVSAWLNDIKEANVAAEPATA